MSRRLAPWLMLLPLSLSGCDIQLDALGPLIEILDDTSGSKTGPTSTTGMPTSTGTSVPVARAESDRPDDQTGNQLHAFYVVPADAEDRGIDKNGTIGTWIDEAASWFKAQSGGYALRYDLTNGKPDVTFFRSRLTEAELYNKGEEILGTIDAEVRKAGYNDPLKVNVYFYDGRHSDKKRAGLGRLMTACVFLPQASGPAMTMVHEVFHALGAVAECAPNRDADTAHVVDNPQDIMAATLPRGTALLDDGRNDYFGHGRTDCVDLAKSPFLDPLPTNAVAMAKMPAATTVGPEAIAYQPAWPTGSQPGQPAVEAAGLAFLEALRRDAGLSVLPLDERLREAARREMAGDGTVKAQEGIRLAGYAGSWGYASVSMTLGSGEDAVSRVESYMATNRAKLAANFGKAGLTDMAVGAWQEGNKLKVAFYHGSRPFDITQVRIGAGPHGTRTLVGRATLRAGQPFDRAKVRLDDQLYAHTYWIKPGESFDFHASVPATGRHEVVLWGSEPNQTTYRGATATFVVDGDKPLSTAFVGAM